MSQPVSESGYNLARNNLLFKSLDQERFDWLLGKARQESRIKGDALFSQGEVADRFYLVMSGRIKLYHLSQDGQEKVVEVISAGNTFAEAVMFMEQGRYPVYAEVLENSQLLVFRSKDYRSLLQDSSEMCFKLMSTMARRLHLRMSEIETLTIQNARHRVIRYLLTQLELVKPANVIELSMTKRLIASRLAMQPETFSRVIHDLKDQGILTIQGRNLEILDVKALKAC
ncbi:Crp/Fnr family transcriptional regulator [Amphritea balenae]|uniref:Crp/Fnr family transcriptional regulator n=1 Tax=Amphritea balenae TaxID=452629 RepID=A0A3P1SVA0_9GAMM|nr:Crp/Fnr family transcriptional regulator [Amphritea balenae]RRD00486.1 Crp/Fnr family transcriptional regulator [Amphritea balenae]GGK70349.1 transcriptional regulator [Amphritea balenae]